jgi:antitoxin ParD1/3/4
MATMNISLPDKMKKWVESRAATGRYSNASDYVRDLIRREQDRAAIVKEIQAAIEAGEASGFLPFDPDDLRKELALAEPKDAA